MASKEKHEKRSHYSYRQNVIPIGVFARNAEIKAQAKRLRELRKVQEES